MKRVTIICLGIGAIAALLLGGKIFATYLSHWILNKPETTFIWYSSKQLDMLGDAAKILIPTITGFAVIVGSGTGYLHKRALLDSNRVMAGVAIVSVGIVTSLACWILVFATIVDCSRAFSRADPPLTTPLVQKDIDYFGKAWAFGITAAKIGTISFFFSVDIALLMTVSLFAGKSSAAKSH